MKALVERLRATYGRPVVGEFDMAVARYICDWSAEAREIIDRRIFGEYPYNIKPMLGLQTIIGVVS